MRSEHPAPRVRTVAAVLGLAALAAAMIVAERRRPLRRQTQDEPRRTLRNLALGAVSLSVVALLQRPLVDPLTEWVERRRLGVVQRLPLPAFARDVLAVLALDYTIYLWHVATHRIAFLWRFHLVHHVDLDLDSSSALRFHFTEMVLSVPYRALQVVAIGTSPRALSVWQRLFFVSVMFHHSNVRLPRRIDDALGLIVTTPRMHGIHHSAVWEETNSNWSSGLSLWDRLHRTLRLDVPQERIAIGVPAYRHAEDIGLARSLTLPFRPHRGAWSAPEKVRTERGVAAL